MKIVEIGKLARKHLGMFDLLTKKSSGTRLFEKYVLYDKSEDALIATDGKRLIKVKASSVFGEAKIKNIPDGSYISRIDKDFVMFADEEETKSIQYPNWKRIWPDDDKMKLVGRYNLQDKVNGVGKTRVDLGRLIVESGVHIDMNFLLEIVGYEYDFYMNKEDGKNRAVIFESIDGVCSVLIMPIRQEEKKE